MNEERLPPIQIPPDALWVPAWVRAAIQRLNLISAATTTHVTPKGGNGAAAFAASGTNAELLLPGGATATIRLEKITSTGATGKLVVRDGRIIDYLDPT